MSSTDPYGDASTMLRMLRKKGWLERNPSSKFWDVKLVFDDGSDLVCSQRDLCAMSSFFGTMFQGNFSESRARDVRVHDVRGKVMEGMVAWYYDCEVRRPFWVGQYSFESAHSCIV
jgi:hypothetical protein